MHDEIAEMTDEELHDEYHDLKGGSDHMRFEVVAGEIIDRWLDQIEADR